MYCSTWNAFTNVTTQGGRQGRIKGHPKGLGKYQEGLPPKGWASTKSACPQGLGKHQECLPPKGLGRVEKWQWSVAELPLFGPSQALGTNNRAACRATLQALLVLAQPFGIDNRAACRATSALLSSPACPPATHHAPPDELRLGLLV